MYRLLIIISSSSIHVQRLAVIQFAYELPSFLGHVRILPLLGASTPPTIWVYNSEHSGYLLKALLLTSFFLFFFSLLMVHYKSLHRSLTFPRLFYDSVSLASATVTDQTILVESTFVDILFLFFFSLLMVHYKSLHRLLTFPRLSFYDSVSLASATLTDQTYLQTRL